MPDRQGMMSLDGGGHNQLGEISLEENIGASLNNSACSPNCRLECVNGHYVMVALTGIAKGMECTWWYGDARKGLDPWMYELFMSQTLANVASSHIMFSQLTIH